MKIYGRSISGKRSGVIFRTPPNPITNIAMTRTNTVKGFFTLYLIIRLPLVRGRYPLRNIIPRTYGAVT